VFKWSELWNITPEEDCKMRRGNIGGTGGRSERAKGSGSSSEIIDLKSPANLKHWVEELKCTPDQLRVAIYKVGCSVDAVKKYVKSLKHD
jgi:hypothetical protein